MKEDVKSLLDASQAASSLQLLLNKCAFIGVQDSEADLRSRWLELKERMETLLLPDNVGEVVAENRSKVSQLDLQVLTVQKRVSGSYDIAACKRALMINNGCVEGAVKYLQGCIFNGGDLISKLRDETGLSHLECSASLRANNHNYQEALQYLQTHKFKNITNER